MFNKEKTIDQYAEPTLFLGAPMGLVDTIHKHFPEIWKLYKEMKSLDWDEEEFRFEKCQEDFENAPSEVVEAMKSTLAWQWAADSVACDAPLVATLRLMSSTEAATAEKRIADNESIHAATYSQIALLASNDPTQFLTDILAVAESFKRLEKVETVMYNLDQLATDWVNGTSELTRPQMLAAILLFYVSLLCMERIQFMASFAVTFTIAHQGWFQEIAAAVKKICQDELEVHQMYRKEVIKGILKDKDGQEAWSIALPHMQSIVEEVIEAEFDWTENYLLKGKSIVGLTVASLKDWVLFNAMDVVKFLGIETKFDKDYDYVPLSYLENWVNINKSQVALQESTSTQYKVNIVKNDLDDNEILEV